MKITQKTLSIPKDKKITLLLRSSAGRTHKGLNNLVENAHQPTRRKETRLIRFKSPTGAQNVIALIGKIRNLFAVAAGRHTNSASQQRAHL